MSSVYNDPEMHHKICKKMAQLTRVIYQMNTRNDENDFVTKTRIQAYEDELTRVVQECNTIIAKYKSELENNNQKEEIKKKLRKLEDKVMVDKEQSRKEYMNLKGKFDDREKKISADFEVGFDCNCD